MSHPSTPVNHPPLGVEARIDPSSGNFLIESNALAKIVDVAANELANRAMPQPTLLRMGDAPTQLTLQFPDGVYVGEVQNGQPHGRGTMDYYPGLERRRYEGQWQDGEFHGKGILIRSNGNQYEGDWENGLFHGKGVFTHGDGSRTYRGEWQFGYQHGQGEMHIMSDGKTRGSAVSYLCEGEKGSRHVGEGRFTYKYKGNYVCGLPHGQGEFNYTGGVSKENYRGEFRAGYYHGKGSRTTEISYSNGTWACGVLVEGSKTCNQNSSSHKYENCHTGVFRNGDLWDGEHCFVNNKGKTTYKAKDGVEQEIDKESCCIL